MNDLLFESRFYPMITNGKRNGKVVLIFSIFLISFVVVMIFYFSSLTSGSVTTTTLRKKKSSLILFADGQKDVAEVFLSIVKDNTTIPDQQTFDYVVTELEKPFVEKDLLARSHQIRLTKYLFEQYQANNRFLDESEMKIYRILGKKLFGWYKEGDVEMMLKPATNSTNEDLSRGVVITTGRHLFPFAVHLIKSIRMLGCVLPVEVYYVGVDDLDEDQLMVFRSLPNVKTKDIFDHIDNNVLKLSGWDIKPFIMLASPFKEVILVDADAVLLYPPEFFFSHQEYKDSGAIFFRDRIFNGRSDYHDWFKIFVPMPFSPRITASHLYTGESFHEQESGIVIINKEKHIFGLLAACRLNMPEERTHIRSKTHGEKETFWLGFEVAQESYEYLEPNAGSIMFREPAVHDKLENGHVIMAGRHIAHFDRAGNLLWFNDGITEEKNTFKTARKPAEFKYIGSTGGWRCLWFDATDFRAISEADKEKLARMAKLWENSPVLARIY